MLSWFRRDVSCAGSVLFRGPLAPVPEELDGLAAAGIAVAALPAGAHEQWRLELRHPQWGRALAMAPRRAALPPRELIDWDPRLSQQEKQQASACGSLVQVLVEPRCRDVLRDRKTLLRFLHALLGSHGLLAMDTVSQACWSHGALEDELRHDAALDISSLFTMHMVQRDDGSVFWLHSHGLCEIGFCDFDLLEPHDSSYSAGYDALRGLAFAIVEGALRPDGAGFGLVEPGGELRLVSARRFLGGIRDGAWATWRDSVDENHLDGHTVVCDAAGFGWFGLAGRRARPARVFTGPFPEEGIIQFSTSASNLMGERARNTYSSFRSLLEELAEHSLPALVKLGYPVDGGGPTEREHLWFAVHACGENDIDATLVNQPFRIARMSPGQRAVHPAELISEWRILTPFGSITPSFGMALREVRSRPDELRRILAEARARAD